MELPKTIEFIYKNLWHAEHRLQAREYKKSHYFKTTI